MTATTSAAAKSFFGKRFVTDILENKKILIINFVLEILGLPVVSVVVLIAAYLDKLNDTSDQYIDWTLFLLPFVLIGAGAIIISILLGFVIALFHYNYLYRKSLVDMHYSLPLSNAQRFFADYISGLAIYLVPLVVSVLLSFVILTVGNVFLDIEGFWDIFPHVIKSGMIVVVGMIMLYTISVFAITFCGSTFEAIFSIIAVNSIIPATIGCVWFAIVTTAPYGMVVESVFYSPVFTATSPIGATVYFFYYLFESSSEGLDMISSFDKSMYIRWMVFACIMIVVYLLSAFLLYKLRKAESVSKPYVYKSFFYAVGAMTVFCIMTVLLAIRINLVSAVVSGIIICGIGWFIMEVIARRGFKRFWTAPLGFIAVMGSVFLLCGICKITDGFGAPRHVPAALSVESVSINLANDSVLPYHVSEIEFRDKSVIKAVTALNKEAVDRHFHSNKYTYRNIDRIDSENDRYDANSIAITYQTLYGSTVKREYTVMSFMLSDVVEAVLCSDEYAEKAAAEVALGAVNNSTSKYYSNYSAAQKEKKGGRLVVSNKVNKNVATIALSYSGLEEFRKAYMQDIKDMTPEELRNGSVYCYLPNNYWVLDSFANTKAFLADHDVEVDAITESDLSTGSYQDYSVSVVYMPRFYSRPKSFFGEDARSRYYYYYYSGYYDGDDTDKYSEVDAITNVFPKSGSYYSSSGLYYDPDYADSAAKLVNAATPIIIGEKPIAIVQVGSSNCYLRDTTENRALLKAYYYGA